MPWAIERLSVDANSVMLLSGAAQTQHSMSERIQPVSGFFVRLTVIGFARNVRQYIIRSPWNAATSAGLIASVSWSTNGMLVVLEMLGESKDVIVTERITTAST